MKMQITLKSGAQIEFECDEFSHGRISGVLAELKWTSIDDVYPKLVTVGVDEVAAVVRLE